MKIIFCFNKNKEKINQSNMASLFSKQISKRLKYSTTKQKYLDGYTFDGYSIILIPPLFTLSSGFIQHNWFLLSLPYQKLWLYYLFIALGKSIKIGFMRMQLEENVFTKDNIAPIMNINFKLMLQKHTLLRYYIIIII